MNQRDSIDSEYLLSLARQKSEAARSHLAEVIMDLFGDREGALSERERMLMFSILQNVVSDIEMSLRKRVAEQLAPRNDVPADLVSILANDEIQVAYPILTECGLLRDEQLIDVIRLRTLEHQLAVSMRRGVSEKVSDALVETGDESVILQLLKNSSAHISAQTMEYLVEQSRRVDSFQEPILRREDLKPDLARKMFMWVSAALREHILDTFDLDKATVDDLLEKAASQESYSRSGETSGRRKVEELTELLGNEGLVSEEMLLTALKEGEIPLFVSAFSRMSNVREYLVMRMLFEPGGEGLAMACKGTGIGKSIFTSVFTLSRKAKPGTDVALKEELPKVLELYDSIPEEAAKEVIEMWRRGADYLFAIRQVQEGLRK